MCFFISITIIILIASYPIFYIFVRKIKHKIEKLNIILNSFLSSSTNNFYYKDLINRTEYLKLRYNNSEFESLEKFLDQFYKTKDILDLINNIANEPESVNNIKYKIISKDKATVLELSMNCVLNGSNVIGFGIFFYDASEHENQIYALNNELNQLKTENQNYSSALKISPYIIWKEHNKKISVLSEKFHTNINELIKYNNFEELHSKNLKTIKSKQYLKIGNKLGLYDITKFYRNSSYFCFAHDISWTALLEQQLFDYQDFFPILIQNIPISAFFIDNNNKIKIWNNMLTKFLNLPTNFFIKERYYWDLLQEIDKEFELQDKESFISSQEKNLTEQKKDARYDILICNKVAKEIKQTTINIRRTGKIILLQPS